MTRIVVLHVLLASLTLLSMRVQAQESADASAKYDFDSPPMSLDFALRSFQERTGVRVSFLPDSLQPFYSNAIRGRFKAFEALELMLRETALDVEWVGSDAVRIGLLTHKTLQRFADAGISTYDGMGGPDAPYQRIYALLLDRMPLTDLLKPLSYYFGLRFQIPPSDEMLSRTYVGPLDASLTAAATLDHLLQDTPLKWEWVDEETIRIRKRTRSELSDVTVEASRLFALPSDGPPSVMLSKVDMERLGISTVSQAIQYLAQQPFSHFDGFRPDGSQSVQLRGLGFDTTLVLINGHAVGASANLYDTNGFDLNTIPLAAVERIEVWLDATPLSVGADAIGGMMNIVLATDVDKPSFDLHYGSAEGGSRERRVSLAGGVFSDGIRFATVLDYFTRDALSGSGRDRWRDQDYRRFGGGDFRSPDANPGNVASLTGDNLPGLPAPFAAVPPHPSGEAPSVSDFLSTAGQRNLESLFAYRSIAPATENLSAIASADWKLMPHWAAFGELLYARREIIFDDLPVSISNAVVPVSNAYNPFGAPVRSNFLLTAIEHERTSRTEFGRVLLGMRGLFDRWSTELTVLKTDDRSTLETTGDIDPVRLADALAQADPLQALNVFDDGPGGAVSLLVGLVASPNARTYRSELAEIRAQVRGDVFLLPAGTVSVLLGVQRRESQVSIAGVQLGTAERTSDSAFTEFRVPLLSGESSIPELSATLQGRVDDLSDLGTMSNSQFALDWHPNRDFSVRATLGSSYRAPSLYELYQPTMLIPARLPDPRRHNELSNVAITFGGNPDLKAATADSWSIGLVLAPPSLHKLNASITYWHTDVKDRISPIELISLLTHEELFPRRVTRDAPSAADVVAGLPGVIRSIDVTAGAEGSVTASGLDVQASMQLDTAIGSFKPEIAATWMDEYVVLDWPGFAGSDRVGVASTFGTIPSWRGLASLTWNRGGLTVTTKARFNSVYEDLNPLLNRATGRRIDAKPLVDIQASIRLERDTEHDQVWRDIRITTGVTNVFNRSPPFAEIGANFGFDPSQGELRGRFGYLRLSKEF